MPLGRAASTEAVQPAGSILGIFLFGVSGEAMAFRCQPEGPQAPALPSFAGHAVAEGNTKLQASRVKFAGFFDHPVPVRF
jgi:hypothetical protein